MNRWQKIGIGIAIAIVALVALGFWAQARMRTFFYPIAPPMPAVVSEPLPEILARLESILKTNAPQVLAGLQPGLAAGDIAKLEQQYQVQLPDDIRAMAPAVLVHRLRLSVDSSLHGLTLEAAFADAMAGVPVPVGRAARPAVEPPA